MGDFLQNSWLALLLTAAAAYLLGSFNSAIIVKARRLKPIS